MHVQSGREPIRRALLIAVGIYVAATVAYAALAGGRLEAHTMNNQYAVQAELWRAGRWYLTEEDITARHRRGELDRDNDWAIVRHVDPVTKQVETRYFNSFPLFPAVLMLPAVALAGSAVMFRDALFVVMLAGVGPALLFLALDRLRREGRTNRTTRDNIVLSLLFAFGTVYFFSAVQGTVWFAAHVVAAALTGVFLLCALDASRLSSCLAAGVAVGCGLHTRPPFILCSIFFLFEAVRASSHGERDRRTAGLARVSEGFRRLEVSGLLVRVALFAVPVIGAMVIALVVNRVRFGDPFETGHKLLNVVWMERVRRWGLFSYHYLSRNLTCALTLLPIVNPEGAPATVGRFQVSGNGLALWVTTPVYLWALWPRIRTPLHTALAFTAVAIALPDLLYHNSGWLQFGYRFSNDFAQYVILLIAVGGRPFTRLWYAAAAWSVGINTWGAATFDRGAYQKYYFNQTYQVPIYDGTSATQSTTYPPD